MTDNQGSRNTSSALQLRDEQSALYVWIEGPDHPIALPFLAQRDGSEAAHRQLAKPPLPRSRIVSVKFVSRIATAIHNNLGGHLGLSGRNVQTMQQKCPANGLSPIPLSGDILSSSMCLYSSVPWRWSLSRRPGHWSTINEFQSPPSRLPIDAVQGRMNILQRLLYRVQTETDTWSGEREAVELCLWFEDVVPPSWWPQL
jgi:hypothetical protein